TAHDDGVHPLRPAHTAGVPVAPPSTRPVTGPKKSIRRSSLMPSHASRAPRGNRRTTLAVAVAIGGLLLTAGGVYAGLNAVATNTTPQTVTSGTLKLTMANNGAGFSQNISDMAPADVVNRFVDLTNGGTLDAQNLTLAVSDATPTKLTT